MPAPDEPTDFEKFVRYGAPIWSAGIIPYQRPFGAPISSTDLARSLRGFPEKPGELASSWEQLGTNVQRAFGNLGKFVTGQ
jgi:hypothetical protein